MKEPIKIYIFSPAFITSGGPEFCQQICCELNKYSSINAKILYLVEDENIKGIHPDLYAKRYNNNYVINHAPEKDSIIFFPEVCAELMYSPIFNHCKYRFFVWMSVNYYLRDTPSQLLNYFPANTYHLYQGDYSKDYLLSFAKIKPEKMFPLVDYISNDFIFTDVKVKNKKENMITFQMDKGTDILAKVIEELHQRHLDLTAAPIKNLTTEQIVEKFSRSKIFLHLGWNPGMDRMPREASMLDNIIILSTLGSGKYYNDHPFPNEYKFDLSEKDCVKQIADKIEECLDNYEEKIKDFKQYKQRNREQKARFQEDIRRIVEFIEKSGNE